MGPLGGAIADRFPRRKVLVAVSGCWGGINIASWQAFVSELVPKRHRLYVMGLTISVPIGNLVQGYLAEHIGPRITVAGAGACFLGVWLVLRLRNRFVLLDAQRAGIGEELGEDAEVLPSPGLAGEPSEVEQLPG